MYTSQRVAEFNLLFFYACVSTIIKTRAVTAKILLDRFVDRNFVFSTSPR